MMIGGRRRGKEEAAMIGNLRDAPARRVPFDDAMALVGDAIAI